RAEIEACGNADEMGLSATWGYVVPQSRAFFQYATSALFHSCASAMEALGTALIICCLKAVVTCSEARACTAAARTISSTSRGVAAGADSADHKPLAVR